MPMIVPAPVSRLSPTSWMASARVPVSRWPGPGVGAEAEDPHHAAGVVDGLGGLHLDQAGVGGAHGGGRHHQRGDREHDGEHEDAAGREPHQESLLGVTERCRS